MVGVFAAILGLTAIAGLSLALLRQRRAGDVAQARAERLSGFLLTLSRANRAVLRIEDEATLWREACQLCVQTGHAVLACVYVRDGQLAHRGGTAGPAAQVLENVPNPLDLSLPEVQASYTARALREGRHFVSNDYVLDLTPQKVDAILEDMRKRWREQQKMAPGTGTLHGVGPGAKA